MLGGIVKATMLKAATLRAGQGEKGTRKGVSELNSTVGAGGGTGTYTVSICVMVTLAMPYFAAR